MRGIIEGVNGMNWRAGLVRFGIALSSLYIIGSSVFLFTEHRASTNSLAYSAWNSRNDVGWQVVGQKSWCFDCRVEGTLPEKEDYGIELIRSKVTCKLLIIPVILLYVIPLAVVWIVIPLCMMSLR